VGTGITEEPPARKIVLNGTSYTLDNLHFHTPSEHVVDDKPFDMELHVVHAALPRRAVIAIFLKVGDRENTALKPLFDAMSNLKNEGQKTKVTFGSDKLAAIFPADMTYFGYAGSLTTPPCDYGVTWMVLKTPIQISKEQLSAAPRARAFRPMHVTCNSPGTTPYPRPTPRTKKPRACARGVGG
jgi:carbonic anhydrase